MLISSIRRLRRSLTKRGLLATITLFGRTLVDGVRNLRPAHLRKRLRQRQSEREFDLLYGVDTAGSIPLGNLEIEFDTQIYGAAYQPIHHVDFASLLVALDLPIEKMTFVDFGSGKGRAILLAGKLPFKRIVGVEFSEVLHKIACQNLERYTGELNCADIELICADAVEYELPSSDPLVLYFYNPFERPVMQRVVSRVVESLRSRPRRIVVIYFTPDHADAWEAIPDLRLINRSGGLMVLDNGPDQFSSNNAPD